jgi:hypothetical protein
LSNAQAAHFSEPVAAHAREAAAGGGGSQFRKLGRRVMYTIEELDA